MRYRTIYTITGIILGLGAPIGWILWRVLSTQQGWLAGWIKNDFLEHTQIYIYLTIPIIVFAIFGFVMGKSEDALENETQAVKNTFDKLNFLAVTDGLTGLQNARSTHQRLVVELETARRYNTSLACVLLDIDDFKIINDTHGHPCGDTVLVKLARILQQCVRRVDTVGRLGGEEFLVILPRATPQMALTVADRIREGVQHGAFSHNETPISMSISAGIATFPSSTISDKSSLLKAADEALYCAKRGGKNKAVLWQGRETASCP